MDYARQPLLFFPFGIVFRVSPSLVQERQVVFPTENSFSLVVLSVGCCAILILEVFPTEHFQLFVGVLLEMTLVATVEDEFVGR